MTNPMKAYNPSDLRAKPGFIRCEGSGVWTGLVAGHSIRCADCGRSVFIDRAGKLCAHLLRRTAGERVSDLRDVDGTMQS